MIFYTKNVFLLSCIFLLILCVNATAIQKRKFDFVVGVDGDFKAAVAKANASGASESKRFIIFFPDGEYDITKLTGDNHGKSTFTTSHVSFIGQTLERSVIANVTDTEGISLTATLYFPKNEDIYMQDLTIHNKSMFQGENAARQVAIQQIGDKFIYKNVKLISGQDTYYTKKSGIARTYWEGGQIEGTVDFICGDGDVFFEGTKLVVKRSGGYITASQNSTNWGYVFNNTIIDVNNASFNGTFYLGRSWGAAKVVFLNTKMIAQPKAEGWAPDMNSAPKVFGEYNSKDGNGSPVNTGNRKTFFDGNKDKSTATTLKTVWDANDAAKYTMQNVIGGPDNWEPNKLTKQVDPPKISQEGANIMWPNNENALCWAIFVNGKYHSNTTSNIIDASTFEVGSKVTVRAANSMGGLGQNSNEIIVQGANVSYREIHLASFIGGTVKITQGAAEDATKVPDGSTITISAIPIEGWEFESWHHMDSAKAGNKPSWTTIVYDNIALSASFKSNATTFQAETGDINNAILESTNNGFEGTGYINFGEENSSVRVPVYVNAAGTYNMTMRYSNGSSNDRKLQIETFNNSSEDAPIITFEKTTDWKTYVTKDLEISLPRGASYITFTVFTNDGPNLDEISFKPIHVEPPIETTDTTHNVTTIANNRYLLNNTKLATEIKIYTPNGKLVRTGNNSSKSTQGLKSGIYLEYTNIGDKIQKRMIQVR